MYREGHVQRISAFRIHSHCWTGGKYDTESPVHVQVDSHIEEFLYTKTRQKQSV